jgi:hypothetical protein
MSVPALIADRVVVAGDCWEWQGSILRSGYAVFRHTTAHRWVYEQLVGSLSVTPRENLMRGQTITATKAAQTHCVHGHEFDEANTRVRANGTRQCRACDREAHRRKKGC